MNVILTAVFVLVSTIYFGTNDASKVQAKLSPEEIVVASKMQDIHRRLFSEKLSAEERRAIIAAVAEGMAPDDALEKLYKQR